jgi:hypothetical protein
MAFVHTVRLGDTSNNGAMFVIQKKAAACGTTPWCMVTRGEGPFILISELPVPWEYRSS